MNTDTNDNKKNSIIENNDLTIESMVGNSKSEKHKLVEELWNFCRKYPNDTDLGVNIRKFILLETMK
jgi:hypothetical protein